MIAAKPINAHPITTEEIVLLRHDRAGNSLEAACIYWLKFGMSYLIYLKSVI